MEIRKIENIVYGVMTKHPETTKDDFLLIYSVYRELNENVVARELFSEVMINHKKYNLPSFHTIARTRRKIFEKHPELKPERISKKRKEAEEEYRQYAHE